MIHERLINCEGYMNERDQQGLIRTLTCHVIAEKFCDQAPKWVDLATGEVDQEKTTDNAVRVESLFDLDDVMIEKFSLPRPKKTTRISTQELAVRYKQEDIKVKDPIYFSAIVNRSAIHCYDTFRKEMDWMLGLTDLIRGKIKPGIFNLRPSGEK
jgi:hypothetical protein